MARHQKAFERYRVERIASRMLSGQLDLLTGLRELVALHHSGYSFIPIVFVGLESETDTVPEQAQYSQWQPTAVARQLERLSWYQPSILKELHTLLEELQSQRW